MGMLSMIGRMAKAKLDKATAKEIRPVRTPAPLSLWQDSAVEVSPVATVLAGAAGAVVQGLPTSAMVVSVGTMRLFGMTVTRSYLSDGRSFLQTVAGADPAAPKECRLYTVHQEIVPATTADWDFLLADADGYVGYPFFDIGDVNAGGTRFPRLWTPGETRIQPVAASETVAFADGHVERVQHRLMQYGRALGDSGLNEYLLADVAEGDDGASFDILLGLELAVVDLSVIPAAA